MAVACLLGLAGLDVGLVDEAVVDEEVVEARGLGVQGRVGLDGTGVVAGSQKLSIGRGPEKLLGCPRES